MQPQTLAWTLLSATLLSLSACDDEVGPDDERFRATLSGPNSSASGAAEFTLTDQNALDYVINVSGLTAATMAHIHGPAAAGQNAGVIAWLYPAGATSPGAPSGAITGELARGTVTATQSATIGMDSLLVLLRSGNAYVNVHTSTMPSGEIRGQITPR